MAVLSEVTYFDMRTLGVCDVHLDERAHHERGKDEAAEQGIEKNWWRGGNSCRTKKVQKTISVLVVAIQKGV